MKAIAWSQYDPSTDTTILWPTEYGIWYSYEKEGEWRKGYILTWINRPKVAAAIEGKVNPLKDMYHIKKMIQEGDLKKYIHQKESIESEENTTRIWLNQTGIKLYRLTESLCKRDKRNTKRIINATMKMYEYTLGDITVENVKKTFQTEPTHTRLNDVIEEVAPKEAHLEGETQLTTSILLGHTGEGGDHNKAELEYSSHVRSNQEETSQPMKDRKEISREIVSESKCLKKKRKKEKKKKQQDQKVEQDTLYSENTRRSQQLPLCSKEESKAPNNRDNCHMAEDDNKEERSSFGK